MRAFGDLQIMAHRLAKKNSGAVVTEYAFLSAFIVIVAAFGIVLLGEDLSTFANDISGSLNNMYRNLPSPFGTGN